MTETADFNRNPTAPANAVERTEDAEAHLAFAYQRRVTSNRLGHALAALREIADREHDDDDGPVVAARNALDADAAIREGAQELVRPASIADLDAATEQRDEANRALAAVGTLAAHWETLASQFDAESRKPEAVADKPHQARLTGRAAQARYCASWLREALGGHAPVVTQEPEPASELTPGRPDEGAFWAWMDAYVDEPHNASYEVPDMQRAYEAGQAAAEPSPPVALDRAKGETKASRCTWWSDPTDDFHGMCVKEAGHDREGHPEEREHENEHSIRWTGTRWEPTPASTPAAVEATAKPSLPEWEDLSDLDRGAALLHIHKRDYEGREWAIIHCPARYFDHPALTALDAIDASDHAATLETTALDLEPGEYERLYDLALAAARKRGESASAP